MTQNPSFQQQLDAKRKAVAAARKQVEKAKKNLESVEAELRGWEEAAQVLTGTPATATSASNLDQSRRSLSENWKGVIAALARAYPKDFSLTDIAAVAEQNDIKVSNDTLRGQMHHYSTQRNYLERTAPGQFRATPEGAAAAGVHLGEDDDDSIPF